MNNRRHLYQYVVITLFAAFLLTSCGASTQLTSVWKDETYEKGPLKSMMIVAVSDDMSTRTLFEDTFVALFTQQGVQAISGVAAMPDDPELDKDDIKSKAMELGVTTVFVTHLVSTEQENVYEPPSTTQPYLPADRRFSNDYDQMYFYMREMDISAKRDYVFLESNLYELSDEHLVWTGKSTSIDPYSTRELIDELGEAVIQDFQAHGLL